MPHFIFIQQISVLNILNTLYNLHFFSSKCRSFHKATLFGFCITHILNAVCAKIWKKKIRRQKVNVHRRLSSACKETELRRRLLSYFITVARISKIAPPLSPEPSRRATNRPFANWHARISFTSMFIYERKGVSSHTVKARGGVEVLVHAFLTSTTDGAEWRL